MGNRTAKFVSALVGSVIAGAPLAAVSQNAPTASGTASPAAECLATPKGAAPQGQHWFYRLERTTKRQCWYLRAAGGKASQTAQATTDASEADAAPSQAVQDARAEYIAPQTNAALGTRNVTAPATANAPAVAPQPPSSVAETNAQQPEPTTVAVAAQPNAKPSKSPAPLAPAAEGTSDKSSGSLQMLMLVIGGALALAGILASIIYRFAGGRVRVQTADRRGHWDDWSPQDHDGSRAPWLGATAAATARAQPAPIDFDELRPQTAQLAASTKEIGRIAPRSAVIRNAAAEVGKADIFNGQFEIEASPPRNAAKETDDEKPVARDDDRRNEDMQVEDAVDVDVITAMLERLGKQGPRLPQPTTSLADSAVLARSPQDRPGVRA
ncbi:hypothetical protein [Bradyrhizobium guangxiense]|uniref:hypothetical protein n=1 Tax=Bradyrhizobium guangxiense TaxID=1325115 RepID=UPI0013E8B153|nr:hypothetical protein [Bradyrhizobium guangxiense]